MTEQLSLALARRRTYDERFDAFRVANPQVYRTLVDLARQAKRAGCRKLGIRMLWERARWELMLGAVDPNNPDGYRLNDHFTSRYARLIMKREPDLAGLFEVRDLRSDGR